MPAFGFDKRHMPRKNSGIASLNREFLDGDQLPVVTTVTELNTLEDASREREISPSGSSNGHFAVACFHQVLDYCALGKRPPVTQGERGRSGGCTKNCDYNDEDFS